MQGNPLRLPGGSTVIKYEVRFTVSENEIRERKVVVDVNDTGNDQTNTADAIVAATLALDDEGIKHWAFKGCSKVTS